MSKVKYYSTSQLLRIAPGRNGQFLAVDSDLNHGGMLKYTFHRHHLEGLKQGVHLLFRTAALHVTHLEEGHAREARTWEFLALGHDRLGGTCSSDMHVS